MKILILLQISWENFGNFCFKLKIQQFFLIFATFHQNFDIKKNTDWDAYQLMLQQKKKKRIK
jgi:hypothetical protein